MIVMIPSVIMTKNTLANELRHVPRIVAIFASCALMAALFEPLKPLARCMIIAQKVVKSIKILKSRNLEISKGLMKLSPGTRSLNTCTISSFQENFVSTKTMNIKIVGKKIIPCKVSVMTMERVPPQQINEIANARVIITMTAKVGIEKEAIFISAGRPR